MKTHHLFLLMLFCASTAWADFSASRFIMHPAEPLGDPFVLEITGDWPTDCHPGEQKPVISNYTGASVLIEFDIILEHVTCNDVSTPFRVLVDMSDVIDGPVETGLETTIRYGGTEFMITLPLACICSPTPRGPDIKPEAGLYDSRELEKQGLLVARQNDRMAVYPLVYDDAGSSEWLLGAGGIDEDVFFSDLYELTGGQCLGCAPPADVTQMNVVGKITMLMDSEGLTQVKINDGLFVPYEQSEFGYGSKEVGGVPERRIPDFSGRWAFVDIDTSPPNGPETDPMLPLVFDIVLNSVVYNQPPIIGTPPPQQAGYALFAIWDIAGNKTAEMKCTYVSDTDDPFVAEMRCEVSSPDVNNGERRYVVKAASKERLTFYWTGPITFTPKPLTAVRVD